jgi:hypothetical protein
LPLIALAVDALAVHGLTGAAPGMTAVLATVTDTGPAIGSAGNVAIGRGIGPVPLVAVPNPPPEIPPGLDGVTRTAMAWGKGVIVALAALFTLLCAAMLVTGGRRQRSATAFQGLEGLGWIFAGLGLAGIGPLIVLAFPW